MTVFADDLHCPTGFEFCNGGVLVAQAPDLMFLKDTDGDDKADVRERVLQRPRLGRHAPHGQQLRARPGRGALLPGRHVPPHAGRDAVRPAGALRQRRRLPLRAADAEVRRLRHLRLRQPARPRLRPLGPGHRRRRHRRQPVPRRPVLRPPRLSRTSTAGRRRSISSGPGPAPASRSSRSRHFPDEMQGNLLVANVIGFQGILQYKLSDEGASFAGDRAGADRLVDRPELPPVRPRRSARTARSTSSTGRTRSSATCSTTSATPAATATHGRIYRVTYEGRPLLKPPKIAGEPIEKLLDLLKEPEDRVRYRARIELGGRQDRRGDRRASRSGSPGSTRRTPTTSTTCSKALWVHQYHNVVERRRCSSSVLASPDFRARAAATRVLCYWRDRVPDALDLLKKLAADEHPRVRLEAVRAASFFTVPEAVEVAADRRRACRRTSTSTSSAARRCRRSSRYVKKAIAEGKPIKFTSAGRRPLLPQNVGTDDLLKMKRTPGGLPGTALPHGRPRRVPPRGAGRPGQAGQARASCTCCSTPSASSDEPKATTDESVVVRPGPPAHRPAAAELAEVRGDLEKLATDGQAADRPASSASSPLIAADGSVDKAWALATKSVGGAAGPRRRDAADPRPRPAGRPLPEGRAAARRPAAGAGDAGGRRARRARAATSASSCRASSGR